MSTVTPSCTTSRSSTRDLAIRGSLWTLAGYGAGSMLRLGSHLVLAWFLLPEVFGLMALVKVIVHGLRMFSDVGIGPSIIQSTKGDDRSFLDTAWSIQVVRGFVLWLGTVLLAWPMARLYGEPQFAYLLPVAGLTCIIAGFASTSLFTLRRRVALRQVTLIELVAQCCSITTMIAWVTVSPTVWAFVAGSLVATTVRTLLSHRIQPLGRDRWAWDRDSLQELFGFGKWIFASTIVTFFASNADKLMLGRLLTLHDLGLYSIGLVFARVAIHVASKLAGSVVFPILARHKDDAARVVSLCIRARRVVLWSSGALCASFAIIAPWFFGTLYPAEFASAGATAQWLALYVWTFILVSSMDRVPLALGRSRVLFGSNLTRAVAGITLALLGYHVGGLPGFIVGLSLGSMLSHLYVVASLPTQRLAMLAQSGRYTLALGGYTLGVIALQSAAGATGTGRLEPVVTFVAAATPLLVALVMIKGVLGSRSASPGVAVTA